MVIVRVRAEDRDDVAIADGVDDRLRGVWAASTTTTSYRRR